MIENGLLRAHVTRVGFDLSLGKSHIAALVYLTESIQRRTYISTRWVEPIYHRPFANFATGCRGLEERGLLVHHYREKKRDAGLHYHYTVTKAGKLVVALLKEAGIYQEYAAALLPQPDADEDVA